MRHIKLQLPGSEPLIRLPHSVTFSFNLELLIIDRVLYDLGRNTDCIEPNILPPGPPALGHSAQDVKFQGQEYPLPRLKAEISACNRYLTQLFAGNIDLQTPPGLYLYCLQRLSGIYITCLDIPKNIDFWKAALAMTAWHPDWPILSVITCEFQDKVGSVEILLTISCYTLDLSRTDSQWVKAEETFSNSFSSMFLPYPQFSWTKIW